MKAAGRGRSLVDEEAVAYGIIPRANRGIFAVNELPDLAPRIQVALLDVMEERDVQIRGFPVRIPLDILMVFSANPEDYTNRGIIANPNCSTIQMLVALKPIHDAAGIERINVCTYQAVSGTGKEAMEELAAQTAQLLNAKEAVAEVYPKQIAFNVLPHIDVFQDNGYTKEEMKMVWETRKIMGDETIQVNPTAVRVPVFYGHSEAVHIETRDKLTADQARDLLASSPGIVVLDDRKDGGYPTAVTEGANRDPVYIGRIREDISHPRGIDMWVVADNVRKGAALNSIQIAEMLVKDYL